MTRFRTDYCAACDGQVTGEHGSSDNDIGPDSRVYCGECITTMRLLQEQRHPGTVAFPTGSATDPERPTQTEPAAGRARNAAPRTVAASRPAGAIHPARASTAGRRAARASGSPGSTWAIAGGFAFLVVAGGAYWLHARTRGADPSNRAPENGIGGSAPADPSSTAANAASPANAPAQPVTPDDEIGLVAAKAPPAEDPPLARLEKAWESASRMVDRSRMRDAVREIARLDAAGDAALAARRDALLAHARRALFEVEWTWVGSQVALAERKDGRPAARAYLAGWLDSARDLFDPEHVARAEATLAELARPEPVAAGNAAATEDPPAPEPNPPDPEPSGEAKPNPPVEAKPPAPERDPDPKPDPKPERKPERDPEPEPHDAPALSADDTRSIVAAEGKECVVEGKVLRAEAARSGKVFWISFGKEKTSFQVVIFQSRLDAFEEAIGDLEKKLPGRTVRVHGRVALYQGRPQIVLDDPARLEVK